MAPEGLDLSAMYIPVAVVEIPRREILEESCEPPAALNVIEVPRGVQVSAQDEMTAGDNRGQLVDQQAQVLPVIRRTDMETQEQRGRHRERHGCPCHVGTLRAQTVLTARVEPERPSRYRFHGPRSRTADHMRPHPEHRAALPEEMRRPAEDIAAGAARRHDGFSDIGRTVARTPCSRTRFS
jgi:hypothetical protein